MKKNNKTIRFRVIKHNEDAIRLLRVLQSSGMFRWERPSTRSEEVVNILTHAVGIVLAIVALVLLVVFAVLKQNIWAIVSCSIFGLTMFLLYFGSTMCHASVGDKTECFFEVWDNIAIYGLIAGTYTPFLLVNLRGFFGLEYFVFLWSIVIFGAFIKIRNPYKQPKWVVLLYLAMGWFLLFILPDLLNNVSVRAMKFIFVGAVFYTVGVVFYLWRKLKFSHAIWHLFVIIGSVCFFFAVLFGSILDYV